MASVLLEIVPLIGLIIFGHVIVSIIKASKSGVKQKEVKEKFSAFEEDLAMLEQELEESRHRIEVLEKIIISEKRDLDQKFDAMSGSK
jgi:hypothetical protein